MVCPVCKAVFWRKAGMGSNQRRQEGGGLKKRYLVQLERGMAKHIEREWKKWWAMEPNWYVRASICII